MILKKKVTARQVWKDLKTLFRDNKDAKVMQLDIELWNIRIDNLLITEYYTQIKTIVNLLDNIDTTILKKELGNVHN